MAWLANIAYRSEKRAQDLNTVELAAAKLQQLWEDLQGVRAQLPQDNSGLTVKSAPVNAVMKLEALYDAIRANSVIVFTYDLPIGYYTSGFIVGNAGLGWHVDSGRVAIEPSDDESSMGIKAIDASQITYYNNSISSGATAYVVGDTVQTVTTSGGSVTFTLAAGSYADAIIVR